MIAVRHEVMLVKQNRRKNTSTKIVTASMVAERPSMPDSTNAASLSRVAPSLFVGLREVEG
jgi:hypothetical protein